MMRAGWQPFAVALVAADLLVAGAGFYPAVDPALLRFVPPAVQFLKQDTSLYRIATLNAPGEKTFNANVGMLYGIEDIRGYDSIIPKQYADWMNLVEGQGELIYNRIAPFYWYGSLDSALLNLANVKYILTTQPLPQARFALVYSGELNIYRNPDVLPRAFTVSRANAAHGSGAAEESQPAPRGAAGRRPASGGRSGLCRHARRRELPVGQRCARTG